MIRALEAAVVIGLVFAGGAALSDAMTTSTRRYARHNDIRASEPTVDLARRTQVCQNQEVIPDNTTGVQLFLAGSRTAGARLRAVALDAGEQPVTHAALTRGAAGAGVVATRRRGFSRVNATPCIGARGRVPNDWSLVGQPGPLGRLAVDGRPVPGIIRIDYLRPGNETWFALLPTIAHRFAVTKAWWVGAWTFWLTLAAVVLAISMALFLVVRPAPSHAGLSLKESRDGHQ